MSFGYIIFIILNYSHVKRNISYDTMQPGEKLSACLLFFIGLVSSSQALLIKSLDLLIISKCEQILKA